jgi:hypothetical protein
MGRKYTTICHFLNTVVLLLFLCVSNHIFKSHTTQRDDRGSIDRLRVGGKRINLLFSKTGVMRSGYLHPETKYDFVVSGEVEVWILTNHGTDKKVRSRSNDVMTLYEWFFLRKKETNVNAMYLLGLFSTFRFTNQWKRLLFLNILHIFCTF